MECGEDLTDGLPATHSPVPDSPAAVFWRNRAAGLFDRIPLPAAFCKADGTILRANPALAAEWGQLAGSLRGHNVLGLFHPEVRDQLGPIAEAIRLHRRSRYPVAVCWTTASSVERRGEVTVDLVDDMSTDKPNLLVIVRVKEEGPTGPATTVGDTEARILALTAGGATTAQAAAAVGLTVDGVNYHLRQLSRVWGVSGKSALVARAYVEGILAPDVWPPVPVPYPYRTVR